MSKVKISACQYLVREIRDFAEFKTRVQNLLDGAKGSDLVLFPELFTIELFTTYKDWNKLPISEFIRIDEFTDAYKELFISEAKKRNQHIVGGSHLVKVGDVYKNIGHLFLPNGEIFTHEKTHIFPAEADWKTSEGSQMRAYELPFGKVGFNICYESEIPECAASLAEQRVSIILCPSATFTEQGFGELGIVCRQDLLKIKCILCIVVWVESQALHFLMAGLEVRFYRLVILLGIIHLA